MTTVQMLLSQLGINANAANVALMGPNGRQLRLPSSMMMQEPQDPAAAAAAQGGSEAVNGAITSAMQSLTMQLMPQQHRLLALPPRLPAAESAALLASAGSAAGAAAGTAAAGGEAGLRGQASNVNALTRLLTRAPEAGVRGYLRDGRGRIAATSGPASNFLINPPVLPPTFGPGANLLQSFVGEVWQQGALGGAGGNMLADIGDSVWDEAVNQLLEALAPHQGLGRGLNRLGAAAMPGQPAGRAGAAAGDDAGLDPRE
jgi:hypothetical protein